jgi:septal ring factor EnvC (AmiA/AmiB activator)
LTASQPPPAPPPAPPSRPEPATRDDLRSIRRWLLVAGVWAVAATAIAVIALVQANEDDSAKIGAQTASQVGKVQRDLNQRLDDIEKQLDELAPTSDISRLDKRLKKVEEDTTKATTQLDKLGGRVDDLESRVDDLESQQQGAGTDTTETTTTP